MLVFKEELFKDIFDEVRPMLTAHWKELALHQEERPLDIDVEGYNKVSDLGLLKILTMRQDGKIIGYASFMINTNLHYRTWKIALCDVYYVDPNVRNAGIGFQFFEHILNWLKGYNVNSIIVQDKIHKPHTKFFAALGFDPIETVHEMVI